MLAEARGRGIGGHFDGLAQVACLDDEKPAHLLFGFGEGAVGS